MLRPLGILLLLAGLVPRGVGGQERPIFGVAAGPVGSVQLRERTGDSERHAGFAVGAWARVSTPVSLMAVLAEVLVVRRGGEYDLGPETATGAVDVDYLAVSVLPGIHLPLGPVRLTAYAGPSLDIHLRSTAALPLQSVFREPATQVFAAVAGVGVGVSAGRASFRLEARRHEQLSSAFSGPVDGLRHRSTEVLFRLGMRPQAGR